MTRLESDEQSDGVPRLLPNGQWSDYLPPSPPPPPTKGELALGAAVLLIGVVVLGAALYFGGRAALAALGGFGRWLDIPAASNRPKPSKSSTGETEAVTLCDLNMQAQAFSTSSYRSDWTWRIVRQDGVMAVRRGFTAKNPYGVDVSGQYTCLVDEATKRIVGLQYEAAGLTVTVPGSRLRQ
jgi:hypothetical protein